MSSDIIIALLSLTGTLLGSGLGVIASSRLTNYRIQQLEKKVEKHNSLVDRMYKLENKVDAHIELSAEQIKVANHRIADLEKEEDHNEKY